jgi:hypothetical protein
MCRSQAEGGRRCPGGHSDSREMQRARQRLCRARRALAGAERGDDQSAIGTARERVTEAQKGIHVTRILTGADEPDPPNHAGLRRAEYDAVSGYTGGLSSSINRYVQNGYQLPPYMAEDRDYAREMRRTVAALERAVNGSPLPAPATATRAVQAMVAESVWGPVGSMAGQTFTSDRFVSATWNPVPSDEFGDVTVVYDLAPGTRALDVSSSGVPCKQDENELLIGPHQDFRVVSDQMEAGSRVIRVQSAGSRPYRRPRQAPAGPGAAAA